MTALVHADGDAWCGDGCVRDVAIDARTVIASGTAGWFEVAGAEARRWTVVGAVVCGACAICGGASE